MKRKVFLHIYFAIVAAIFAVFCLHAVFAADPFVKNSDGNYYSADMTGGNVTVAPGVTARGIDVSHHENYIDWEKIRAQYDAGELDFVILRCGAGATLRDSYWRYNSNSCERLGIPFGVYLYSKATSAAEASAEADFVLGLIEGRNLSYPVYYDVEDETLHKNLGASTLKKICRAFCEKIKAAGYEVGVYSQYFWITDEKILGSIDFEAENYSLWIARYAPVLNYSGKCDIWQCSEKGTVDGIDDEVDIDFLYVTPRTANHCYVTFDLGDAEGNVPSPVHLEKGEPYGVLPELTSPDGRIFDGWYTEREGGTKINADDIVETAGKLTLFAHWYYRVEIDLERAAVTSGTATAEVTKKDPYFEVSFRANDGYFLPDRIDLPSWLEYARSDDKLSATLSGRVQDNLALTVSALPMLDRRIVFDGEYLSTGIKNATFTVDGREFDTDGYGVLKIREEWLGKTLVVTYPGGNATAELSLPARRGVPEGLSVRNETYLGKGDGRIVGLDETMEYSVDGGETFADCPPEKFECGVRYIIRYKATDADFCGKSVSATIKSGRKIVVTFVAEGEEFMVYEVGYGEVIEVPELPEIERCDMENSHWDIDLVDVPLTGDVVVTAVYQKLDGCGRPIPNEAAILLVAFTALAVVIFKKKN